MKRGSLLVVDDHPGIRRLLEELFSAEGYTVVTAASGLEAITLAQMQLPNIVIADLRMPGISGLELRHKILSLDPNIRCILMSAYTDQDELQDTLSQCEFDYVLTKPFDLEHLLMIVTGLLNE